MSIITSHETVLKKETKDFIITLIPMRDDHLPLLYEWNTKSEVLYWCEGDDVATNNPEAVRAIYGGISKNAFMFIVCVDGNPVGDCWLQDMNLPAISEQFSGQNIKRIDLTIYREPLWGKGLGRLINSMLLEFGFHENGADIIFAITEDYNVRAQKCLLKSGFRFYDKFAHEPTLKGIFEYAYSISREEFSLAETR